MAPTACTPAMACPAIQAPTPLEVELAALVVAARCPAARLPVEAWVTAALLAALLEELLVADMANKWPFAPSISTC